MCLPCRHPYQKYGYGLVFVVGLGVYAAFTISKARLCASETVMLPHKMQRYMPWFVPAMGGPQPVAMFKLKSQKSGHNQRRAYDLRLSLTGCAAWGLLAWACNAAACFLVSCICVALASINYLQSP